MTTESTTASDIASANPPQERDTETLRRFAEDAMVHSDTDAFFGENAGRMAASFATVHAVETDPTEWTSDSQQAHWCDQWIEANGHRSEPIEDITGTYPCNDGDWIGDVRVPGNAGTADFRLTRNPVTGEIVAEPIAEVLAP